MFDHLRSLFSMSTHDTSRFAPDDHRTAIAALLVHVMAIDGSVSADEHQKLEQLLENAFGLGQEQTEELIEEATRQDSQAVDLYNFTSLVKRALDEAGRLRIIEMLWEMAFADGDIDEFENSIIKRIADLIGIDPRTRVYLRQKVQAAIA